MKTKLLSWLPLLACAASMNAQTNLYFSLWPEGAPGALGNADKDIPTLTVFLPEKTDATDDAMVICPGGGYGALVTHEGKAYAQWFNEQGIAGFVLKYRLGSSGYRHPVMLQDAARAPHRPPRHPPNSPRLPVQRGCAQPLFSRLRRGGCA